MFSSSTRVDLLGKPSSRGLVKFGSLFSLEEKDLLEIQREFVLRGFTVILARPSPGAKEILEKLGWLSKITSFKDRSVEFYYPPGTPENEMHPGVKK